jgi:hypothetical protein
VSKMRPTDKRKAHREEVYRDTEKSTEKSTKKLTSQVLPTSQKTTGMQSTETRTEKSTKSNKSLLKLHFESACMKSTRWSLKRTSKDHYLVNQHLEVNATYR